MASVTARQILLQHIIRNPEKTFPLIVRMKQVSVNNIWAIKVITGFGNNNMVCTYHNNILTKTISDTFCSFNPLCCDPITPVQICMATLVSFGGLTPFLLV